MTINKEIVILVEHDLTIGNHRNVYDAIVMSVRSNFGGLFDIRTVFRTPCEDPSVVSFEDQIEDISNSNRTKLVIHFEDFKTLNEDTFINVAKKTRIKRKDIFAIGILLDAYTDEEEQFDVSMDICKKSSFNLVASYNTLGTTHSTHERKRGEFWRMFTPEESSYKLCDGPELNFDLLMKTAKSRSHLTFTRSNVVSGRPISWSSNLVPKALREVVNYCISQGAYKVLNGVTVGHFACKLSDNEFLTSIRKSNFNDIENNGLVRVTTDGPDNVLAYGAKPSVGGQSQRIVFEHNPGTDCIVHFHCPLKKDHRDSINIVSQIEFECGSHECGKNTSDGLSQFGNLKAVYLENHGPNIVFSSKTDPKEVIDFIEANFELSLKTNGYSY